MISAWINPYNEKVRTHTFLRICSILPRILRFCFICWCFSMRAITYCFPSFFLSFSFSFFFALYTLCCCLHNADLLIILDFLHTFFLSFSFSLHFVQFIELILWSNFSFDFALFSLSIFTNNNLEKENEVEIKKTELHLSSLCLRLLHEQQEQQ